MKKCEKCGYLNQDTQNFCGQCGNQLNVAPNNTNQRQFPPQNNPYFNPNTYYQPPQQPYYQQPTVKEKKGHGCLISFVVFAVIFILIIIIGSCGASTNDNNASKISTSQSNTTVSEEEYKANCKAYTYTEIARNPNDYKGKQSVFTGQVVQVQERGNNVVLRVDITAKYNEYLDETNYSDTIYVEYKRSDENESRILEDDIITMYGELNGLKTYESILGESISIPSFNAKYIDINE